MSRARNQFGHLSQIARKLGGMDASLMARMRELEDENRRLKKMYAEEKLRAEIIAEAMQKKW